MSELMREKDAIFAFGCPRPPPFCGAFDRAALDAVLEQNVSKKENRTPNCTEKLYQIEEETDDDAKSSDKVFYF
jgi:hypothetical protein